MKTKTKVIIVASAVTSALVGLALATPIFDLTAPVLGMSNDNQNIDALGRFATTDGVFTAKLSTEGPSTIFVQDVAYSPGGHTGWHSHPGVLAVTLISGSLEWFDGNCQGTTYNAGDAWTEGSQRHYFRNTGTTNVHLLVTYIIAQGAKSRIDLPAPPCAAGLGLD